MPNIYIEYTKEYMTVHGISERMRRLHSYANKAIKEIYNIVFDFLNGYRLVP